MVAREPDVIRAFVTIADGLVDDFDVIDMLNRLTSQCAELLDIASAGLLLADERNVLHVVAASTEQTRNLELFQTQREQGPCLDCFRLGHVVTAPDLRYERERWPQFVPAALSEGFASVHALPMRFLDDVFGTLGLFGTSAGTLNEEDLTLGQALAHVASVVIVSGDTYRDRQAFRARLREALDARVVIEQAKGFLAEELNVDMDEAYDCLRGFAQAHGVRLSAVARELIARAISPSRFAPFADLQH